MEKHEKRNEQPPIEERSIELLVYGAFTAFEGDKGEYCTAWVQLPDILLSIPREVITAKVGAYGAGLAAQLEKALLVPAAAPASESAADGSPIGGPAAASPNGTAEEAAA